MPQRSVIRIVPRCAQWTRYNIQANSIQGIEITPMTAPGRKAAREIDIFKRFVAIAGLQIDPGSIEKTESPDIRFHSIIDGSYAVELAELVNQTEADALGWQGLAHHALEAAHEAMAAPDQQEFDRKFRHAILCFVFRGRPSKPRMRQGIRDALVELITLPDGAAGPLKAFRSSKAREIIESVEVLFGGFNGPLFQAQNILGVGDPITNTIRGKLAKKYRCACPIDLVAYLEIAAMHPPQIWRGPLLRLTRELTDLGPFRRIWVVDLRRGAIEDVTTARH